MLMVQTGSNDNMFSCDFNRLGMCFEPATRPEDLSSIFSFSEYLAVVAIFVVAYSISDQQYKLRMSLSRFSPKGSLSAIMLIAGMILLLSNIWFSYNWLIPRQLNDPLLFEVPIAFVLLFGVTYWLYVAFIHPPVFTKSNALRYARVVFSYIAYGEQNKLKVLATEIVPSINSIFDTALMRDKKVNQTKGGVEVIVTEEAQIACDLISILGDPRFCKVVAESVPSLAAEVFYVASKASVHEIPLEHFSRNVASEFYRQTSSALHFEDDGFRSGLIGRIRPISRELFSHVDTVEGLANSHGSPLAPDWRERENWDIQSWQTYLRCCLLFLDSRFKTDAFKWNHDSYATNQIFDALKHMCSDAYLIEGQGESAWRSFQFNKVDAAVSFIGDCLKLLDKHEVYHKLKGDDKPKYASSDIFYDHLVDLAFEVIFAVSSVQTSEFINWQLQYSSVWSPLFGELSESKSQRIFNYRLQRKLFSEIRNMDKFYNFKGAKTLSLCLNVLGFKEHKQTYDYRTHRAFHKCLIIWTKAHYLHMVKEFPKVAESCLSGTISFDPDRSRLVKTYQSSFGQEPAREFLDLN